MGITSKPQVFETSDGAEFVDEDDAKYHEELLVATREFTQAKKRLNHCLSKTLKTADGKRFDVGRWANYWFVAKWHHLGGPAMGRVQFGFGTVFTLEKGDEGINTAPAITVIEDERGQLRRTTYRIGELYAEERNAKHALLVAMQEYVVDRQDELAKLDAELNAKPVQK